MSLSPDEQATVNTYDQIAEEWSTDHHTGGFWRKEMQRFHKLLPKGDIIEIGSGGGRDAKELVELGYNYVGTDVSGGLLKIAQKNLPAQKFYKQSVYKLNFPKKFDGFWCSAVLLHIPKPRIDEALQKTRSILKTGAIGFISIKDGQGEEVKIEQWNSHSPQKRLFSFWRKAEFEKILEKAGFSVVDYSYRPDSEKTQWHCFFVKAI